LTDDITAAGTLRDKMHNVVVTGGSRGIGLAISRRICGGRLHVTAVARHESDELREAIRHATMPARMVEYLLGDGGGNIAGSVLTIDDGNTA
jgi:NAD(P)-dependent dehydrogenase (short-subunit alcohol dehydrogenase family)